MIKVKVNKDKLYTKITISGHAMYDDYGKDIVCSAVSSIVTTTINGCLSVDENSLSYLQDKSGITIDNIKSDEVTQKLMDNMVNLLKELETNYKKNIEVK